MKDSSRYSGIGIGKCSGNMKSRGFSWWMVVWLWEYEKT